MDLLNFAEDPAIRALLLEVQQHVAEGHTEQVRFSARMTKVNRREARQERLIFITDAALYNLDQSKRLKR
jgi:hypothetical protein